MVGTATPISQMSVGEMTYLAEGLSSFYLPKLKELEKSHSLHVYRKPEKSLWSVVLHLHQCSQRFPGR